MMEIEKKETYFLLKRISFHLVEASVWVCVQCAQRFRFKFLHSFPLKLRVHFIVFTFIQFSSFF